MYLKQIFKKLFRFLGVDVSRVSDVDQVAPDVDSDLIQVYSKVKSHTMTSAERIYALCEAVRYISRNNIPGDIVECGVWKGGSMMAVAEMLIKSEDTTRGLHLFDTYEGMPPPTANDLDIDGVHAQSLLDHASKEVEESVWCKAPIDIVRDAMASTGYPSEKIKFVKGLVEQTIPEFIPEKIAILRLDTDWYESTKHEMEHLFPRLVNGGVLIIDDYGHWQGARKAIDDYIEEHKVKILLNRIDYTGRIAVKVV